ncbi:MAG: penicillin-binding protein [Clostridia bacterium]|nr:penicillin-binding protein [Clostridia bacterium]
MAKHRKPSLIIRVAQKLGEFFGFIGDRISYAGKAIARLFKKESSKTAPADSDIKTSQSTQVFESVASSKSVKRKGEVQHKTRILPHISKEHLSGEGQDHINMFRPQTRNRGFIIGTTLTSLKLLMIVIFMVGSAGIGTLVGVAKAYMETTPTLDTGKIENQSESSYIYDNNDELITAYTGIENRDWASITEIPLDLQNAVIAIEDVRFEYHTGVDVKRLLGAFLSNLMNDDVQGGSTLTQQLIKNRLLTFDRTYERKIQEAYLAFQLEQAYSKEDILEAYMNTIHLGASNYGVKAAAMDYFGKSLDELTLRECAMIAGIIRYPYYYNPRRAYYSAEQPEIINDRTDDVLYQMYISEFITEAEYQDALADTVAIVEESVVLEMYDMPYFVEYAVYDVITHFLKQRNMQDTSENRASIENEIRTNGYRIYTTVDTQIQTIVQDSLSEWDNYPALEDESGSVIREENDGTITQTIQPQAAVVVMDHSTGDLLAVVGGRETPLAKKTLNRAYQTTMPVGSSIKPIAVYAPAIDKGYSDGSIVPNLPLPIDGWDSAKGFPLGGSSKYGPVPLRTALVSSLNSATAYTLLEYVGLADSKNYLINLGVNPAHISETGAGLALGTSGITPIEMAGAYATIANSGVYLEPLSFRYVTDKEGNVILSAELIREKRQVFKPSTAWLVADMLVDAVEYGTGTRAQIEGMTIGGKTGTNQNATGVFFAGISPYYTTTLWIGHDMYDPLADDVYASNSAAPLWQYIMSQLLDGLPNKSIIETSPLSLDLVSERICTVSGLLATDACNEDPGDHTPKNYWFLDGTQPTKECDVHEIYTFCTISGKIASSYCPTDLGILEERCLLFLKQSSIYWDLSQDNRDKYLPGTFMALNGLTVAELTPDMENYHEYICDVHTEAWHTNQQTLLAAIEAATAQIEVSYAVLNDESLGLSEQHKLDLQAKITELEELIANPNSTLVAIEQVTLELQILTDTLLTLYNPPPAPEGDEG